MSATYLVRLASAPGRLSTCVPHGRGVIEGVCSVCHRARPASEDVAVVPENDGLVSHGIEPGCVGEYLRRYCGAAAGRIAASLASERPAPGGPLSVSASA